MVKTLTAYTEEVDEIEDGIAELLEQIDLGELKKNSAGVIVCHCDFVISGFIAKLRKKLPFDVIGMTTMTSGSCQGFGMYSLTLTVLTSDELAFETVMSDSLDADDYRRKIKAAHADATGRLGGDPSLIVAFLPFLKHPNGAEMHHSLDEICGGVPVWGGIATHTDAGFDRSYVFRNEEREKDRMAMLFVRGPLDPEFIVISLPSKNIEESRGKITMSDGCVLKEINGIPSIKYLESIGITIMENAPVTTPLMVYYEGIPDPVALAIYAVNDDGGVSCGGEVTEGASVAVGEISAKSVIVSAEEGMERVLNCGKRNGMLLLPCVSRSVMLEPNHDGELKLVSAALQNGAIMPFMAGYSGGEICPVRDSAGVLRNRFHNFTFSVCVF